MTQLESNIVNNPYCVGGSMSDISIDNLYFQLYRKFSFVLSFDCVKKEIQTKLKEIGFKTISFNVDANKIIPLDDVIEDGGILQSPFNNFLSNVIFLLNEKESILIRIYEESSESCDLFICADEESKLSKLGELIKEYQITQEKGIGILYSMGGSIAIRTVKIKKPEIDINLNYGEHFNKIHDKIINELNKNMNGLFLFHGVMGSGKTTYIKYLSQLVNRLFIFVPTGMVESLVSPSLISTLLHHQNAVLILEDAEKAIESRSFNENTSLVSTILNLSDGILGTILNTAIMATFNTEKENIDKALLRKGRLKLEHKFEKLSVKEAQKLINKLNKKYEVTEPMSLADIYNIDENNLHVEESSSSIGFK